MVHFFYCEIFLFLLINLWLTYEHDWKGMHEPFLKKIPI